VNRYKLNLTDQVNELPVQTAWQRSLLGARRELADLIRLQIFGVMWAATGIDQDIPERFTRRQEDLEATLDFHDLQPPDLKPEDLALDVLQAGHQAAGDLPVLLVNEPMFISGGENSDLRYNFFYPRWAYDDYRQIMQTQALEQGWNYLDLWDAVENTEFTNSAVHLTAEGTRQFAQRLGGAVTALGNTSIK
jgi:hypothetical protein